MKRTAEIASELLLWAQEKAFLGEVSIEQSRPPGSIMVRINPSGESPLVVIFVGDDLPILSKQTTLHVVRGGKP